MEAVWGKVRWLKRLRQLRIRYQRLAVMQDVWNTLAACAICYRSLHDDTLAE